MDKHQDMTEKDEQTKRIEIGVVEIGKKLLKSSHIEPLYELKIEEN